MNFADAFAKLIEGEKIKLKHWDYGVYLFIQPVQPRSSPACLCKRYSPGDGNVKINLSLSHTELMAIDWVVVTLEQIHKDDYFGDDKDVS